MQTLAPLRWINAATIIWIVYNILPGHFKDIFESLTLFGTLTKFTGVNQYFRTFYKPQRFLLKPKAKGRKVPIPNDPDSVTLCSFHRIRWLLRLHFGLKSKVSMHWLQHQRGQSLPGRETHVLFLTLNPQASKLQASQVWWDIKRCLRVHETIESFSKTPFIRLECR